MASSGRKLIMSLIALFMTTAMAQTPGGGGSSSTTSDCTNTMTSLAPCLAFVTGNSTKPSDSCCSQLGTVVQATPQCLCILVNGGGPSFLTINQTLALSLPGACKVQTPPVSQCKAADADAPGSTATPPGTAPAPTDSSNDTPEPAITPTASDVPASSSGDGTGSKTVPSTSDATTTTRASMQPLLVGLLIAAIARF